MSEDKLKAILDSGDRVAFKGWLATALPDDLWLALVASEVRKVQDFAKLARDELGRR